MMKVTNTTSRKELHEMAKGFQLKFVGVSTDALVDSINAKIDELLDGSPAAEPKNENVTSIPTGENQEQEQTDDKSGDKTVETSTDEEPKKEVKTLADFELAEGQVVQIIGEGLPGRSKNLDGRKAEVVGISRRGFVRVVLLNKEGQKQNCTCPIPAGNLTKVEKVKAEDNEGAVA